MNIYRITAKLANLNVYRAKCGPAPHKPLLLLVLFDLAEQNLLPKDVLPLTPELAFRFCTYWTIVAHRRFQRPDIRLPFHHMQSDGFWSSEDGEGKPSQDMRFTRFARLSPEFVEFSNDSDSRNEARHVLIQRYFQIEEKYSLYEMVGIPPPEGGIEQITDKLFREKALQKGREARFRLQVVSSYNYGCALTGYRLTTITAGSIVDAAHVHRFADSRNNDPRNGVALCKNAHWMFDNGLWTLTDGYLVIVASERFVENSPDQRPLKEYHGQRILLPRDPALWPDPAYVAWHRKNVFQN